MADSIYQAGDIEGYDFAFDAAGKIVDWSPVVEAAQSKGRRLTLSLAMLFTEEGEVSESARSVVTIPKGSDEVTVRQRVYSAIREYIRAVGRRLGLDEDQTPADAVALLSEVTLG